MKSAAPSTDDNYYVQDRPEMMVFIPTGVEHVLELGCAEGGFASSVKRRTGAEVWGIEYNEEAAAIAATTLDRVLVGDADEQIATLPDRHFDVIICNDVLEHLVNPADTLRALRSKIAPGGIVVASIPNIRHLPALSKIVWRKDFPRQESGIFDRTHLRFFTKKSIIRMFTQSGYSVQRIKGINGWLTPIGWSLIVLSIGYFADGRHLQFAVVATPSVETA